MKKAIFIATTCAILTACGGGSSGSSTGNSTDSSADQAYEGSKVALSSENFEPATAEILESTSNLQAVTGMTQDLLSGAQVDNSVITPADLLRKKLPELAQLVKQKEQLTGAVISDSIECYYGGSMDIVANDKNNNDEFDAGDSATLTLNNCREAQNLSINGKMSFTINSGFVYSDYMSASTVDISVELKDFSSAFEDISTTANGSFRMKMTESGYQSLQLNIETPLMTSKMTQAGKTKVFQLKDYTMDSLATSSSASWTVNGKVNVPTLGANTASIKTLTRFSFTSAAANSAEVATAGKLEISFDDGSKVFVEATGTTNAKLSLDLNSDGIYETQKLVPWIDVL